MKSIYLGITAALILGGCAGAQQTTKQSETARTEEKAPTEARAIPPLNSVFVNAMEARKTGLATLDITASVNATMNGTAAPPANCSMTICHTDSLGMTFRAFGLPVGKLYARNDYFLFFDAFNNRALEGNPSAANIAQAIRVPLSYNDFAHLLRGEAPGDLARFTPVEIKSGSGINVPPTGTLLQAKTPENGMEYVLYSPEHKTLAQYQRKAADGTIQLNVRYEDFTESGGIQIAKKVAISIPSQNSTVTFDASEIKINSLEAKRLLFSVPSAVPRSRLE